MFTGTHTTRVVGFMLILACWLLLNTCSEQQTPPKLIVGGVYRHHVPYEGGLSCRRSQYPYRLYLVDDIWTNSIGDIIVEHTGPKQAFESKPSIEQAKALRGKFTSRGSWCINDHSYLPGVLLFVTDLTPGELGYKEGLRKFRQKYEEQRLAKEHEKAGKKAKE